MTRPIDAHIPGATPAVESAAPIAPSIDSVQNPGRRDFLRRTAAITAATAVGLVIPEAVFAAQRQPLVEEPATLTTDGRIAQARSSLVEMRDRNRRPHRIEAASAHDIQPFEERFPNGFAPGARIDRGIAKRDSNGRKRYYVVGHDGWWEQQLLQFAQTARNHNIPWSAFLVQPVYAAFPDTVLTLKNLGARIDGNHGTKHEQLSGKPYEEVVDDFADQTATHNKLFLKSGIQVPEQPYIAVPYFDGAIPGESYTDAEIKKVAKNSRAAIVGASIDTLVWAEGTTETDIEAQVIDNIASGAIIVTHPDANGIEAAGMNRWAPRLRRMGYAPHPLSELRRTTAVAGA